MVTLKVFAAGELILKEGEFEEKAYSIEKGRVEVFLTRQGQNIPLHILGPGDSVGEMSIIDDKPLSASVRAIEETTVKEIHRNDFAESLEPVSDFVKNILKGLFERLRNANDLIAKYEKERLNNKVNKVDKSEKLPASAAESKPAVILQGVTPEAKKALSGETKTITQFPYRIGRKTSDPFTQNHLSLPDKKPYHVSRHHVAIIIDDAKPAIIDSGSQLGTQINNVKIGGKKGKPGPVFLQEGENTLIFGDQESKFHFKVLS